MEKIKVYELAKKYGYKSLDFVTKCQDNGFDDVRTHSQHVTGDTMKGIIKFFDGLEKKREEVKLTENEGQPTPFVGIRYDSKNNKYQVLTVMLDDRQIKNIGSKHWGDPLGSVYSKNDDLLNAMHKTGIKMEYRHRKSMLKELK